MPLMITDRCTKKPVAHIWNFIFLYAHAPFFSSLAVWVYVSFWHSYKPHNTHSHTKNAFRCNVLCVFFLIIFTRIHLNRVSVCFFFIHLYLWHQTMATMVDDDLSNAYVYAHWIYHTIITTKSITKQNK